MISSRSSPRARRKIFAVGLTETNRLEAFSDGVFTVAITVLVLDLRLPTPRPDVSALWPVLYHLLPTFTSWVLSFVCVLVLWVNHHSLFNQLRHTGRGLMWLNGMLLFGISFIPFPTSLAGEFFLATPGLFLAEPGHVYCIHSFFPDALVCRTCCASDARYGDPQGASHPLAKEHCWTRTVRAGHVAVLLVASRSAPDPVRGTIAVLFAEPEPRGAAALLSQPPDTSVDAAADFTNR